MKTLESVFDVDKSGPELLQNVVIGEVIFSGAFDGELIYPKVVNDHTIEIIPSALTVSLKPELKKCTDFGVTVLKSDCILELSDLNNWKEPLEINAPEICFSNCSFKNLKFIDKGLYLRFTAKELRNCTIDADYITMGSVKVNTNGLYARNLQKTLKLPFKNCKVSCRGRFDIECAASTIKKLNELKSRLENGNVSLTKELNLSGVDFSFIEYSFRDSNELLCLSRNVKNAPELHRELTWNKSTDGVFYVFTNQKMLRHIYSMSIKKRPSFEGLF